MQNINPHSQLIDSTTIFFQLKTSLNGMNDLECILNSPVTASNYFEKKKSGQCILFGSILSHK